MAILADIRGQNVRQVFARRIHAVMTAIAAANDIGMVKNCRHPPDRSVAIIAIIAACEMRRCFA